MISYLEGTIEHSGDRFVILSTGPIGYRVYIVPKLISSISKSQEKVKLHIHSQLNVRDGTFDMYGFPKREDLDLFHLLIGVNGIGPKNAMNILSIIEPQHLKTAVMNEDAGYLKKVSGLGPKTAQRLILELKNKIDYLDTGDGKAIDLNQEGQAIEALMTLGYSIGEAKEAMKSSTASSLEDRVRQALKFLGKK